MSRTELLSEGLVILPSEIAPGPAGVDSGHHSGSAHGAQGDPATPVTIAVHETVAELKSGVDPSRETSGRFNQSDESEGESGASEPDRTEPPSSSAWASSRAAVRSDTGEAAWRLTPKAISHLFGSPNPPYRRVDETLLDPGPGSASREPDGTSNSSGQTCG